MESNKPAKPPGLSLSVAFEIFELTAMTEVFDEVTEQSLCHKI
jgi:hypothetical protein